MNADPKICYAYKVQCTTNVKYIKWVYGWYWEPT